MDLACVSEKYFILRTFLIINANNQIENITLKEVSRN